MSQGERLGGCSCGRFLFNLEVITVLSSGSSYGPPRVWWQLQWLGSGTSRWARDWRHLQTSGTAISLSALRLQTRVAPQLELEAMDAPKGTSAVLWPLPSWVPVVVAPQAGPAGSGCQFDWTAHPASDWAVFHTSTGSTRARAGCVSASGHSESACPGRDAASGAPS